MRIQIRRRRSALIPFLVLCLSCFSLLSLRAITQTSVRVKTHSYGETLQLLSARPAFSPLFSSQSKRADRLGPERIQAGFHRSSEEMAAGYVPWWLMGAENEVAQDEKPPDAPRSVAPSGGRRYNQAHTREIAVGLPRDPLASSMLDRLITDGVAHLFSPGQLSRDRSARFAKDAEVENPFAQAVEEASKELETKEKAPQSVEKKIEPKQAEAASLGGAGVAVRKNFLLVGFFANDALGVVPATLISEQQDESLLFELEGLGKSAFAASVLERHADSAESLAFGDINLDGTPDLVVTNRQENRAYVEIGVGGNKYEPVAEVFGGLGPSTATLSDFNADGSVDIAVGYATDSRIAIDGKGLRKFVFLPYSSISERPYALLPGDFNGDGFNDLLVLDYQSGKASTYLNRSDATFALAKTESIESLPSFGAAVDLNGDSYPDTIVCTSLGDHLSVGIQDGRDGSFAGLANLVIDPRFCIVVGDFNGDGVVDVAVAVKK